MLESLGFFALLKSIIAFPFRGGRKRFTRRNEPLHRINERIRAREVRVVSETGDIIGVLSLEKALSLAKEQELDLVEISPKADPPVCKIIDYGKFLYEHKKKEKVKKKSSKGQEIKGVRLSFGIGVGDLERQLSNAKEFLGKSHPIRIQMILRGREKAHRNLAFEKMKSFLELLGEEGSLDQPPKNSGSQIIAIMKPKGKSNNNSTS